MARIDLEDPYTSFLESQVKAGLFNTVSEAVRDAIRKQMEIQEQRRLSSIAFELAKGETSLNEERIIPYSPGLIAEISEKGKKAAIDGAAVRNEIRP